MSRMGSHHQISPLIFDAPPPDHAGRHIVKIHLPTSNVLSSALVYDQTGSILFQTPVGRVVHLFPKGEHKVYAELYVLNEVTGECMLGDCCEAQSW